MRYFWDAVVALDPAASSLDEGPRFPICQPERLMQLFRTEGLPEVEVRMIDIPTVFRDFDDYWSSFLGGQGLLLAIRCHAQRSDAAPCESAFVPRSRLPPMVRSISSRGLGLCVAYMTICRGYPINRTEKIKRRV
jgi:hypothetical protein